MPWRVVESDKATSGAVRDLVGLLASTLEAPQMLAYERLVESSRVVRELTAKLRKDPGVAASNLVAICGLERELAEDFSRRGKYSESRTLLMDVIELLEGRRSGALDPNVVQVYARSLMALGSDAGEQQRYDEALVWLQRAEEALARRDPNETEFHVVLSDAFEQEAINAWKVKDFPTIEAATRNALVAAWTAIHLDPRNRFARIKVAGLQDKMAGLTSQRPPS